MDVVVPCYNYGHFLEPLVESVLAQEGVCVRIVIVDDASPDGSGDVADRIARSSSNVQVVRHAQNRGHITTYNEGLAVGDSTYLLLLSADDMLAPGALKRATTIMDRHASVGLVYGFAPDFVWPPRGPSRTASLHDLARQRVARHRVPLRPEPGGDAYRGDPAFSLRSCWRSVRSVAAARR